MKKQKNIDRLVAHVLDDERDSFIEELPSYLPNDVDCSPEVEADAVENPEKYDTKAEHLYTVATLVEKGK